MITSSLKVLGKFYYGKGKTIMTAIGNLNPEIAKGVGVLTLEKHGITKEKIILPRILYNAFGKISSSRKELALKQISQLFDKKIFDD